MPNNMKAYDNPDHWHNAKETMQRFDVSENTLTAWVKENPKIMRYKPGNKTIDKNGRTVRRFPMYNWHIIINELFTAVNEAA